ncbi:MAG: sensor histidine kinase [Candidatus Tectomicrobia bacterium]|nr:sensor histidine kinase [Candidatus Tectomicrobia bacterium]
MRIRSDAEHTEVEITDRGPGIGDEESSRVFDRFYRIDNSRTRETGGFGLGLALVRAIATLHNAEVKFRKGVTVGTVVSVTFRAQTVTPASSHQYAEHDGE